MNIEQYVNIYNEGFQKITSSSESWKKFLSRIGYLCDYNFVDIVCILRQNPSAYHCKTPKQWNKLGRYIKRDTTGIELYNNAKQYYVFDIRDTVSQRNIIYNNLWSIEDLKTRKIVDSVFRTKYNVIDTTEVDKYMKVATYFWVQNEAEILKRIDSKYKQVILKSVAYAIASRCGDICEYNFDEVPNMADNREENSVVGVVGNIAVNGVRTVVSKIVKQINLEQSVLISINKMKGTDGDVRNTGTGSKRDSEEGEWDRLHKDRELLLSFDRNTEVSGVDNVRTDSKGIYVRGETIARGYPGVEFRELSAGYTEQSGRTTSNDNEREDSKLRSKWRADTEFAKRESDDMGKNNDETGGGNKIGSLPGSDLRDVQWRDKQTGLVNNDNIEKEAEADVAAASFSIPTITCNWSESAAFEAGKTYSIYEFDLIMKQEDSEHCIGWKNGLDKYGSEEVWAAEDEAGFYKYLGYEKTKFTVNMPDGSTFTERQDIGDGDGGVIDFLDKLPQYSSYMVDIKKAYQAEREKANEKHNIEPIYEQLSLFDTVNIAPPESEQIANTFMLQSKSVKVEVNYDVVDSILPVVPNKMLGRYIVYGRFIRPFKDKNKMINFLRDMYNGSIKGLSLYNGSKIAVFGDSDGIKISYGTSACYEYDRLVTYDEAYERIEELIKHGRFLKADELPLVRSIELNELVKDIALIIHDCSESKYLAKSQYNKHSFHDTEEYIKDIIKNSNIDDIEHLKNTLMNIYDDAPIYDKRKYDIYGGIYERIDIYNDKAIIEPFSDEFDYPRNTFILDSRKRDEDTTSRIAANP